MKHTIKENRVLIKDRVQSLCVRNNYCTGCDNHQYYDMISICDRDDISICDAVMMIADKIIEYSDVDQFLKLYNCAESDLYESICFNLINDCTISFISVGDTNE